MPKGPAPDPFEQVPEVLDATFCRMLKAAGKPCTAAPTGALVFGHFHEFFADGPVPLVDTSCLTGHVNLPHGSHTTNLHTHGLHVEPGFNANGTVGDNTFLRVLPRADGEMRKASASTACRALAPHERVAWPSTSTISATCSATAAARGAGAAASARHALVSPARARRPRTIRSPAGSPASSSSKATSTMRSIGR